MTASKGRGFRVAVLCNRKARVPHVAGAPADYLAEYDTDETVQAIVRALESAGHEALVLEADSTLLDTLRQAAPDICFNIAEGLRGEARESQVPALLEMLGIPYTGSGVLANALSLDKAMCKRVWMAHGLPTAPFQVFHRPDEPLRVGLRFPLFVKPVREGSGMGVDPGSVVHDEPALRQRLSWAIGSYRQPALVEPFLQGREFTVGLIGNNRACLPVPDSCLYDERGFHVFPVLEIDVSPIPASQGIYSSHVKSERPTEPRYLCPAPIGAELARQLQDLAVAAFLAIGALDVGRLDFRLDEHGKPHLLEINTLPGLNPRYSDIVMAARGEGMPYESLVNEILQLAIARYGLATSSSTGGSPLSSQGDRVPASCRLEGQL
jgi:D-alanine-D-alanine ligase